MTVRDEATTVRDGEDLDIAVVESFLKDSIPDLKGEATILQFPSGHSNLTYLVGFGDRELVLRRPPFGTKAKTAHDMGREFRMLSALKPVFPYCPKPLVHVEDESLIGCPFYVMERVTGIILRRDLPSGMKITPAQASGLCDSLLDVHTELHTVDYHAAGLADYGKPEGYVRRQVEGWSSRYRAAKTPDAPDFEETMTWLSDRMPPDTEQPSIVHNDFKFDNIVLDESDPMRIIGVLDWEMATIGDPLMDVGNSLAYWVERDDPPEMHAVRLGPTHLDGMYSRRTVIEKYAEKSGRPVGEMDFYYCFGLFRLAVIAQQIYYRYYHGQTKDERFKTMIVAVQALDRAASRVIASARL